MVTGEGNLRRVIKTNGNENNAETKNDGLPERSFTHKNKSETFWVAVAGAKQ